MNERINAIAEAIASCNAIIASDEDPMVRSALGGIGAQLEDLKVESSMFVDRRSGFTAALYICRERVCRVTDPAARQAIMSLMMRLNEKLSPQSKILRP